MSAAPLIIKARHLPVSGPHALDVAVVAVLAACATMTFGPVFGGTPGYLAAGGGALIGLGLGLLTAWRRIGTALTGALALVAYLVFVGPFALRDSLIAGVLPSLDTLERGSLLIVQAWRDLLTVGVPASSFSGPAVVPFLAGLVCVLLGMRLALLPRFHLLALLPLLGFLVVGILWGLSQPALGIAPGAVFAVAALIWGRLRLGAARRMGAAEAGLVTRAFGRSRATAIALAAGVLALGTLASAGLAVGVGDRVVLRNIVQPPLDLRAYASPLMGYRYLENDEKSVMLFSVSGLPKSSRVRLATLDAYDGIVYNVADSSAGYARVGSRIDPRGAATRGATTTAVSYTISGYQGVWLPGGGDLRGVSFTGAGKLDERANLYYNSDTGTALVTSGLADGAAYTVQMVPSQTFSDAQLAQWGPSEVSLPQSQGVPDAIGKLAAEYTADAHTPIEQLRAIEKHLQQGYYSNGQDGNSLSGHSEARISAMLASPQLVGDDEQYAVAMALMARQLGLPARVVMGFYPATAPTTSAWSVTGNDAHVWVEVAFNNAGWVQFDPTPNRDRAPKTTVPKPQPKPRPRVQPPPVPPNDPAQQPTNLQGDKTKQPDKSAAHAWLAYVLWGAAGLGGLLVLTSPLLIVAGLRVRRRRHRLGAEHPADRLAGGWAEVVDAANDLGYRVDGRRTRQEVAADLALAGSTPHPVTLAQRIDSGVFGPGSPAASEAEASWLQARETIDALRRHASRRQRWTSRVSIRSLRHPALSGPVDRRPVGTADRISGISRVLSRIVQRGGLS